MVPTILIMDEINEGNRLFLEKKFQDAIKKSFAFVKKLEMELPDSGWLSGSSFGLGDAAVVPYVTRMEHLSLGEIFDQNSSPKVSNWLQRIKELPFYKEAVEFCKDFDDSEFILKIFFPSKS